MFFSFPRRHGRGSRESTTSLPRKQNSDSRERKIRQKTCLFFRFREATTVTLAKHNLASRGSKTVTLAKKRKTRFFPVSRGTAVTLAKPQPCSHESKIVTLVKIKKTRKCIFFSFSRRLSQKQNRASRGSKTMALVKEKMRTFVQK